VSREIRAWPERLVSKASRATQAWKVWPGKQVSKAFREILGYRV
jgi:hypothetical protein